MKTPLLLIACLFTTTVWGIIPIPNGGFENWNSRPYENPENYPYTSNTEDYISRNSLFNVTKTDIAQNGNYALKMVTLDKGEGDNIHFGYCVNAETKDGGPDQWKGGIPYTERPTGISGYFKYNQPLGDTALIILSFKKNGATIQSYVFTLFGLHTDYTPFNFTFSPALNMDPDSMIIGFASSYATKEMGLAGSELYIDNVTLTGVTAQPAKLNGDFESWESHAIESPEGWSVNEGEQGTCRKTDVAVEGNYAIELETYRGEKDGFEVASASQISNGYWDNNSGHWAGGIPFTNSIDTLAFSYKYTSPQSNARAEIILMFIKNGYILDEARISLPPVSGYQTLELPFRLTYGFLPDSVVITARSNNELNFSTSYIGSVLTLDNLHFKQGTSSQEPVKPVISNGSFEDWVSTTIDYPEFYPYSSNNLSEKSDFIKNMLKTDVAQHGNFAVRLVTNPLTENNDNNMGFFMNALPNDDNPANWVGGIPCSERPTGIKGFYKYNQASADSGMVILTFSKAGSKIGIYAYPLKGEHAEYTPFDFTFNPALPMDPDSMVLGFASSYNSGVLGIAGSELYVDNVSLNGVVNQPTKLNGDFETWNSTTMNRPTGWYCQSSLDASIFQSEDAIDGNYSLRLLSYEDEKDGEKRATPSVVSKGYWDNQSGNWTGGIPFNNNKDTLVFHYKYAPAQPKDSAQVLLFFQRNGQSYWGENVFLTASAVYKYVELPFEIYAPMAPDNVIISIESSLWSDSLITHIGSELIIDNIYFKSIINATSVKLVNDDSAFNVYPNPTNGRFAISYTDRNIERVDIYNLAGQKVLTLGKDRMSTPMEIDMTLYPRGIYLIRIDDGKKTEVKKLILN